MRQIAADGMFEDTGNSGMSARLDNCAANSLCSRRSFSGQIGISNQLQGGA